MSTTTTINTGLGSIANNSFDILNTILTNPKIIILFAIIIVIYFALAAHLGTSISTEPISLSESSEQPFAVLFVAFFAVLVVINGLQYFFGVDIVAKLKDIFTERPEVDIVVDNSRVQAAKNSQIFMKKQVFNVPGNDYVYPDAKALCQAYGARLATYSEIEDSYNSGAEWCNYGWSEGQMALFPTQQKT
jgi:hypothetical protein